MMAPAASSESMMAEFSVARGESLKSKRALRDPPARPGEFVLDGDRNAFERPCVAAAIAIFGLFGFLQRLVEVLRR